METELPVLLLQVSPDWHLEMEDPACLESGLTEEKHDHSAIVDAQMGHDHFDEQLQ